MGEQSNPRFEQNQVGYCPQDESCPEYDGKRCQLMGCRPGSICEPWAMEMVADVARLTAERDQAVAEMRDFFSRCPCNAAEACAYREERDQARADLAQAREEIARLKGGSP